ncbi:MAG TPA: heavy metal-associated domain-containing protein [Burkholderiaceae bacterium]|nr:heavy metal-associated domain-containing protein [Burkholderiaceae bacterium]
MKTFAAVIAALIWAVSASGAWANEGVSTIRAEVNGMVCAFCAQGIEKKMKAMPQTKDVLVNLDKHVVAVELKPGQTVAHDRVKKEIVDAGYEVVKIETVPMSVQDLRTQLK